MSNRESFSAGELLTQDEINLLGRALLEWDGPAHCSDELAVGMGFSGVQDLLDQRSRLRKALKGNTPISSADWVRILLSVEIVFVSDVVGSGTDWSTTVGMGDEETIRVIRRVQRKLGDVIRGYYGGCLNS